ncbi:hypothetical protein FZI91_04750 [Mycobacterium sp. CBMA271]|uniref:hypothetical protein n=1 Tax=unclassified Mycobacteroides TaxID=2618759 RepID=UPI001324519C|nr:MULTISPECIES: hypothetical protein [unclassified Mycobacteroides]MUM19834.1 hypothetical protein [Mycobacteroides sp. CBMA 326]MUM21010.1 hypothetical protein [Mycobacteroides sp. CBMA 271]
MFTRVVALGAALSLVLVGCSDVRRKATEALDSAASQVAGQSGTQNDISKWNAETIGKAFTAVNEKVGANPADYVSVLVSGYSIAVKAIDPKKRENVDEYRYNGAQVQTAPVDVSSNEPGVIEQSAFVSDTVDPAVLAAVLGSAVKDSGVEEGKIVSLSYSKTWANDAEPVIRVFVESARAKKNLRYTQAGVFQDAT